MAQQLETHAVLADLGLVLSTQRVAHNYMQLQFQRILALLLGFLRLLHAL